MKKKKYFLLCLIIFSLLGCSRKQSYNDYLITAVDNAISTKNPQKIIALLTNDVAQEPNILNSTKELINFIPNKIITVSNKNPGVIRYSVESSKALDGYFPAFIYQINYNVTDDCGNKYHIYIQYKKKYKYEKDKEGVWYIAIKSYDKTGKSLAVKSIGKMDGAKP